MPLYEYKCGKCGLRFERIEPLSAAATKKCPKCGAKAERQIAAPAIQFKGSGWYVTDYAGKSGGASESSKDSGGGASAKSSDKSPESKPASTDASKTKKK